MRQVATPGEPPKKVEADSGGESASAVPVRGRGGWGRDQDRDPVPFLTRARDVIRRAIVAERDPHIRIGLRLALDEVVAGLRPGENFVLLVVEDIFAFVGANREQI